MPTSVNVNRPSPYDRTSGYAKGGTRAAVGLLIAVGLVWLAVGTIYLSSAVGLDLQDAPVYDPEG